MIHLPCAMHPERSLSWLAVSFPVLLILTLSKHLGTALLASVNPSLLWMRFMYFTCHDCSSVSVLGMSRCWVHSRDALFPRAPSAP